MLDGGLSFDCRLVVEAKGVWVGGGGAKDGDGFDALSAGSGKGESDLLRAEGGRLYGGVGSVLTCTGGGMGSESACEVHEVTVLLRRLWVEETRGEREGRSRVSARAGEDVRR